jgi:sulfonate transport system permease protein
MHLTDLEESVAEDAPAVQTGTRALRPADAAHLERPVFLGERVHKAWIATAVRAVLPVSIFAAWWLATSLGAIDPVIFPGPAAVLDAFLELYASGELAEFCAASLQRAAIGLSIGLSVGLTLGVISGLSALGEWVVDPTMQMFRAVPFLALAPLFITWLGIDETFKVVLIAFASALPMYAYAYLGVRNVDKKVVEAARGFGLRGFRLLTSVILPSALPNLLMALRICMAIMIIALIAAEGVGTTKGIGYLVLLAKQYYRQDYMVLCVVMYATLGLVLDGFIRLLERYSMPWRRHIAVR